MFKIKLIPSIIFHARYGAVCIRFTFSSYTDCENKCTLSCYHHQIGSMIRLPLFRVWSWSSSPSSSSLSSQKYDYIMVYLFAYLLTNMSVVLLSYRPFLWKTVWNIVYPYVCGQRPQIGWQPQTIRMGWYWYIEKGWANDLNPHPPPPPPIWLIFASVNWVGGGSK